MLEAKLRQDVGSKAARKCRWQGSLPASICGENKPVSHIILDHKIATHKYDTDSSFFSRIIKINVDGHEESVVAKSVQLHPVTDSPIHIQFMRVSRDSKIHVFVPVKFINEDKAPGIKLGGMLTVVVRSLEIVCSPQDIADHIAVDLEGAQLHHTVHLKDLNLPASIRAAYPERDDVIATITAPAGGEES